MTRHELDAAGIGDPQLRDDYLHCRALNAQHGRTYFLATRLLPPARRPAVHALYGFARWADDIVDGIADGQDPATGHAARRTALQQLSDALDQGLTAGWAHEPVVRALADTARRHAIDPAHFTDFMASMQSDLHVRDYADFPALRGYMHGSAAVIGLQMLPVLGHVTAREEAEPHAAALGVAFQMTNFLRDVGEDLDRGRVYLPRDLLAAHGTDRAILQWSRATGRRDRRITAALRDFAGMTRGFYRNALPGIAILDPVARPCIRTACVLYGGILTAVERDGWAVLHRRSSVPRRVRASVALDGLVRVGTARVRAARAQQPPPTTAARATA